ncbi:hypothetical protein KIH86_26885 [Paenibacillus sp. HN-1]|uniref:LuxR C-terminal-related transcriptional regulator n=1 Tax=Paenibacillus TaxID=44249 RepID=UPI001CA99542|nr:MULTISPECIES: LuxR C-terminal-related transcriptional regulator [Paenibacillus]MBY9077548.1 hypothetical protein [Paenibacillus sp. CGMCC 1.18879]MBY9087819.1 hypothetical protein [Paenibacillus sinensis]
MSAGTWSSKQEYWYTVEAMTEEERCSFGHTETGEPPPGSLHRLADALCSPFKLPPDRIIETLRDEIGRIASFIPIPFAAFLTDEHGFILDVISHSLPFRSSGLEVGSNLAKGSCGLNAVSLSMEKNGIGVVRGDEHTLPIFRTWNCVSAPLEWNGDTRGYIDLSFESNCRVEFAIPFVKLLSLNAASRLMQEERILHERRKEDLEPLFEAFRLSPGEREIAQAWMARKSAMYIAGELGIAEETVLNMVRSIYTKMNVGDRGQFMSKLAPQTSAYR